MFMYKPILSAGNSARQEQRNEAYVTECVRMSLSVCVCSVMVSTKGDTRAHRLPKDTCRFGTDLKFADMQSVKSTKWVNDFVASAKDQMVVNTDRYIFQMSALTTMLSKGPQVSFINTCKNLKTCLPLAANFFSPFNQAALETVKAQAFCTVTVLIWSFCWRQPCRQQCPGMTCLAAGSMLTTQSIQSKNNGSQVICRQPPCVHFVVTVHPVSCAVASQQRGPAIIPMAGHIWLYVCRESLFYTQKQISKY